MTARGGDQVAHDDRTRQGRDEWITALVQGVRSKRWHGEVRQQLFACVHDLDLDGPGGNGPLAQGREIDVLADVDCHRDHLVAELGTQPAHRDRRVEATRIGKRHPLFHFIPTSLDFTGLP